MSSTGVKRSDSLPSPKPNFISMGTSVAVNRLMPLSPWRERTTVPTENSGVRFCSISRISARNSTTCACREPGAGAACTSLAPAAAAVAPGLAAGGDVGVGVTDHAETMGVTAGAAADAAYGSKATAAPAGPEGCSAGTALPCSNGCSRGCGAIESTGADAGMNDLPERLPGSSAPFSNAASCPRISRSSGRSRR